LETIVGTLSSKPLRRVALDTIRCVVAVRWLIFLGYLLVVVALPAGDRTGHSATRRVGIWGQKQTWRSRYTMLSGGYSASIPVHQSNRTKRVSSSCTTARHASPSDDADHIMNSEAATVQDDAKNSKNGDKGAESAHLQLGSMSKKSEIHVKNVVDNVNDVNAIPHAEEMGGAPEESTDQAPKKKPIVLLYSYTDPATNRTLKGLGMSKNKFFAWVNYTLSTSDTSDDKTFANFELLDTEVIQLSDEGLRSELRTLWKERNLLTKQTEVLAVYKSDNQEDKRKGATVDDTQKDADETPKRGGFSDLLVMYAERLAEIIEDEIDDHIEFEKDIHKNGALSSPPAKGGKGILMDWLAQNYGMSKLDQLSPEHMFVRPEEEQFEVLQQFLEWFRSQFPYYYDKCGTCGASAKDDPLLDSVAEEEDDTNNDEGCNQTQSDDTDDVDDDGTFLGYVFPNEKERRGKASRTEIYQCHKCGAFTRFPRFNSATWVIDHKRGRCGEYSILCYRFLRALGHEARWVVDWADHVWAEVRIGGRWVHLDPCEAAVDRPLLYQEWGKRQTYILAFCAPLSGGTRFEDGREETGVSDNTMLIEDVTSCYTSDEQEQIWKRRDESSEEVLSSLSRVRNDLKILLENVTSKGRT